MVIAAQDQAVNTNNKWNKVFGEKVSQIIWLCGGKQKIVAHIVSECLDFVQNKYKKTEVTMWPR